MVIGVSVLLLGFAAFAVAVALHLSPIVALIAVGFIVAGFLILGVVARRRGPGVKASAASSSSGVAPAARELVLVLIPILVICAALIVIGVSLTAGRKASASHEAIVLVASSIFLLAGVGGLVYGGLTRKRDKASLDERNR